MKTKIILFIGILYSSISYGQILSLDYDTDNKIPDGAYIKDINNLFQSYIGTWQGTWDGKTFTVEFKKNTHKLISFPSGYSYYRDELIGKYRVQNINGEILENTMIMSDDSAKLFSLAYPKDNRFNFLYSDNDRCSNTASILFEGNPSTNQLIYRYRQDSFWMFFDCQYTRQDEIPIYIPKISMTLTRIN